MNLPTSLPHTHSAPPWCAWQKLSLQEMQEKEEKRVINQVTLAFTLCGTHNLIKRIKGCRRQLQRWAETSRECVVCGGGGREGVVKRWCNVGNALVSGSHFYAACANSISLSSDWKIRDTLPRESRRIYLCEPECQVSVRVCVWRVLCICMAVCHAQPTSLIAFAFAFAFAAVVSCHFCHWPQLQSH